MGHELCLVLLLVVYYIRQVARTFAANGGPELFRLGAFSHHHQRALGGGLANLEGVTLMRYRQRQAKGKEKKKEKKR
jgi:hypothetical protein